MKALKIDALLGKTLVDITQNDNSITFTTNEDESFMLCHEQDCCESVYIESIVGDLTDLIGNPILVAEESTSGEMIENANFQNQYVKYEGSFTWTFYKLATIKGYVDVRWFGSSNGFYSEAVDFKRIRSPKTSEAKWKHVETALMLTKIQIIAW